MVIGTKPPVDVHPALRAVESVIVDPLRFKQKLRIGEDAYKQIRTKKNLQEIWRIAGAAKAGAAIAGSQAVASTLFGSTASMFSIIGLGTAAATPVGWIIVASVAMGGTCYGVGRLLRSQGSLSDTIPHFITTPVDLLGIQLLDLMGALALRVSLIDGNIAVEERALIRNHFVNEWGYDPAYVDMALRILSETATDQRVKDIARALAEFQAANSDCNGEAMQRELLIFLREIERSDGVLDEREDLAIDAIAAVFRAEGAITLEKVGASLASAGKKTGVAVDNLREKLNARWAPNAAGVQK